MTDSIAAQLDALFAAPVRITVGGKRVAVRGVWLGELADFLRLYARKPAEGAAHDAPEVIDWMAEIVQVLARLCGETVDWVTALDDASLDDLFAAMWEANRVLFEPGVGARTGPRGGASISWATAAAVLIEAGHRPEDIERYTLVQIEQYMAAHARLAADRRLEALSIARASQADQKGYRSFLRTLEAGRAKLGR